MVAKVTAATLGISPVLAFAILGLMVNRLVDFVRNGFDKTDRIPKAIWLLIAWAIGIGLAFLITASSSLEAFFGLTELDHNTALNAVLSGIGFGSVGGFWHELLAFLGASTPAPTPKGFGTRPPG